ncbi:nicotinic acid mononucleotide adenylyltransferase [Paenibacillus darwinianus]|uniref:Probable nicotinate-nucleotide adenylyltransferase n=1 Tax=Paenibacillus darwinianus TaxID=1380763 RepID=A0A9W5W6M8_9BACL|nr:nicotinate-nucleotide adenylyltransferase [Paenibacillus darwinianus]EXX86196.1 nicotinic acid mononucleotide adenylyltransferase [Paenibacillus darwinianus]EXX86561.1 nicotinic acid mononucleotide adenylyltransferase [Paenibacillus darwinianus]EXX89327.1 nicotinic acid mononucleotide adenylyltransferase [Paenibacillus darwinianus]
MQVGIMGGTFDPIHIGHMVAAETAREAGGLDEVWFIPSAMPPLKNGEPSASGEQRLEMVYRAVDFQPYFRAMDIELERGGVSYSIDTVRELQALYPGRAFTYIIGADRLNDLGSWRRVEELAELVSFIGLERPGHLIDAASLPSFISGKLRIVQMPQLDVSSTDIRGRRAAGRSIRFLVPDKVYSFIIRNHLYET